MRIRTALSSLLFLSALMITPAHAAGKLTVMEPISDRDERQISIDEVKENVNRGKYDNLIDEKSFQEDYEPTKFQERNFSADQERDIYCLTEAIYFESLGEPEQGKIAVANVIMNRANWEPTNDRNKHHYEFSKSICDVVNFKAPKTWKRKGKVKSVMVCAFSYRCERGFHRKLARVKHNDKWNEIKTLATDAYLSYNSNENTDPSEGAQFYHANYVKPKWRKVYKKTRQIGAHIFYRIP
jgi:spore germination cell wall hydrolase CwlJ-like protein